VVNFTVTSKNAPSVNEVELRQADGYLLAEQPNLADGLLGGITADLSVGSYQIYCSGADQTTSTFTVSGTASSQTWKKNRNLVLAVHQYGTWVNQQLASLVSDTDSLAAALDAGDIPRAEALYVPAREDFESIEPECEGYGVLYPDIDGQIENFGSPKQFRGFHEIEESLWVGDTGDGQASYAARLQSDVRALRARAAGATYQPVQIGDFAVGQLEEASNYLVTGSEERYSNLELVDLKGTLAAVTEAVSLLQPTLGELDPTVLAALARALTGADTALAQLAQSPGAAGSGYQSYTTVSPDQRQVLAEAVLAVVPPLSQATQLVA
jgi:iron uptake system component EfeO